MPSVSRRVFLRRFAASLGAASGVWALASCNQANSPTVVVHTVATSAPAPSATPVPSTTPAPAASATVTASMKKTVPAVSGPTATEMPSATVMPSASPTAVSPPYLVVARGSDQPEELVNHAIAALGGIERFVKPGNDVIIKPNICVAYHTYEYAATTNPWVVGALVKLCKGAGASRVRVYDYPFGGTPEQAYKISGIQDQVIAAGGEMQIPERMKFVKTDIPQGKDIHTWPIYEDILKADVVINVPIAKSHDLARLTLGMKNLMGTVQNRELLHYHLGQRLADLFSRVRPALTVVDAVRILMAHGPTGGNLADVKKLDTVLATADVVAADTYAASFFGVKPADLDYITAGAKMGLGTSDLSSVKIAEITVGG